MPKTEMLFNFTHKIWHCGAIVSILSILLFVAGIFYFDHLFASRSGLHSLPDHRMPIHEIWAWQLYVFSSLCEICFVGAIFAVFGGVLCLMYGFGLKALHLSRP
jgi:hypothetical protein